MRRTTSKVITPQERLLPMSVTLRRPSLQLLSGQQKARLTVLALAVLVCSLFVAAPTVFLEGAAQKGGGELQNGNSKGEIFVSRSRTRLTPVSARAVNFGVSPVIRNLPAPKPVGPGKDEDQNLKVIPDKIIRTARDATLEELSGQSKVARDAAVQASAPQPNIPATIVNFEGQSVFDTIALGQGFLPPDGDVGPNHYVQAVNVTFRVYDKTGVPLTPVRSIGDLFGTIPGACAGNESGNPIVLYDSLANRWLISQFCTVANPNLHQLIAISQTADPTGAYYLYDFMMPNNKVNFDSKFGVWPDGYYMTDNQFNQAVTAFLGGGAFAFDRAKLLAGDPTASFIYFDLFTLDLAIAGMLPSDADGLNPPPPGAPNVFAFFTATEFNDPLDGSRLFDFHADFAAPANSTFIERAESPIAVAAFNPLTPPGRDNIEQPPPANNATAALEAIGDRLMNRLQYRNFGTHQSLIASHTVNVGTGNTQALHQAGVRYYELRNTGAAYSVNEQATFAPDTVNRWMGSAAMDRQGNLAVGYSVSDAVSVFPGIRYAGRLAGDPPNGLFQGKAVLQAGGFVQTINLSRWGSYSSTNVDPSDDCTFWHTNEYYLDDQPAITSEWHTRVGSFKVNPTCQAPAQGTVVVNVTDCESGLPFQGASITIDNNLYASTLPNGSTSTQLIPGPHVLVVSAPNYFSSAAIAFTIANGNTTTINVCIAGAPLISSAGATITVESCSPADNALSPVETVTVDFGLKNSGAGATSNLVATLQATGGVTSPSGPQNYGALPPDNTTVVTRPFAFTVDPAKVCGDTVTATLQLQDGANNLGTVSFALQIGVPGPPAPATYGTGNIALPIPDAATLEIPINVPDTGFVDDVNVRVRLNHTFDGDLGISLVHPEGTAILLSNHHGGSDDNFGTGANDCSGTPTVFDDEAGAAIASGTPPFAGSFRPDAALSGLDGKPKAGTWKLRISDTAAGDVGTVGCVTLEIRSLQFTCCVPSSCTLTCPANITVLNTGSQGGAIVSYPAPTEIGAACTGVITCSPPSGSFFAVGTTTVNCSDSAGPSCSFTVTVTPSALDVTFNGTGKTLTGFGFVNDTGLAIASQPDGKYVVAGSSINGGTTTDFSVVRYNSNGSLDTSFGTGGKVITPIGSSDDLARAVKIQSDGKIVVAGSSRRVSGFFEIAVVRYSTDGSLDTAFGGDGIVTTAISGGDDVGNGMAIQADGKIVVAGSSFNGSNDDFAVIRLNGDGSLDTSFDGDGKVTTPIGSTDDFGNAMAIQADGKIVVVGRVSGPSAGTAVVRYNSNGSLDTSFAGDGIVISDFITGDELSNGVVIQTDGKIVAAVGSLSSFGVARYNSNGSLDSSFGANGRVFTDFGAGSDICNAVAIQFGNAAVPDRIVVAGSSSNGSSLDFAVVRYNLDGSLDTSFDGDGKVTTPIGAGDEMGFAMVIQGTLNQPRKITVAGVSRIGTNDDFAVVRYLASGSLDTSFDGDGIRTDDVGSAPASAKSVAIQTDGKLVVAGSVKTSMNAGGSFINDDFAVARYKADGLLDASFDSDGRVTTAISTSGDDRGNATAIQADGKIIVAGGSNNDFAVARYNPDGSLDTSFDVDGKVTTSIIGIEVGNAVAIQSDGKIIVAGSSSNGSNSDFAVVRYNSNGSLDTSFDNDGKVTTAIGAFSEIGNAVAIQSDGKIIVAGFSGSNRDFAVVRYNTDGSLDTSFSFDGKVTTPVGAFNDDGFAVAIQSDGKIVVAGETTGDFAVVRYNADGSLDTSFSFDGKVTTPVGTASDAGKAVAIQTDGKILVAGSGFNGSSFDFAVVRYNTDGSLDNSYGTGGKVMVDVSNGGNDFGSGVALDSIGRAIVAGEAGGLFGVARLVADSCSAASITAQPTNQTTCAGSSAILTVTASGTISGYQWRKNGANLTNGGNISGATSATLTINPATASDAASYDVVVTGFCSGSVTSAAASLSVNSYSLSSTSQSVPGSGGNFSVNVLVGGSCPWTALSNDGFITITSGGSGNGGGTLNYSVASNPGGARSGTMTIAGLTFTVNQAAPTVVRLISFTAAGYDSGVYLEWQTGFEVDNLGFHIYREEAGKRTQLNPQLVAGSALVAGSVALGAGRSYSWWDKGIADCGSRIVDCQNTQYWLQDVDLNGVSTWHGPFYIVKAGGPLPEYKARQAQLLSTVGARAQLPSAFTTVEATASLPQTTETNLVAQKAIASSGAVKLAIKQEGWYRVTREELLEAGLAKNADPRNLQLFVDGVEQPMRVVGNDSGSFETLEAIEFYGVGTASPYSNQRTYWLVTGDQPGRRVPVINTKPDFSGAASFPFTVERKERTLYFASLLNSDAENWFGAVVTSNGIDQPITIRSLDEAAQEKAELEIALQGVTSLQANPDHQVEVRVNGQFVGYLFFDGRDHRVEHFSIPLTALKEGDNLVTLSAGDSTDVSLVDRIRLTYPHRYTADGNSLKLTTAAVSTSQAISGFTTNDIRVFDVTDPADVRELTGVIDPWSKTNFSIAVDALMPNRTLLSLTTEKFKKPASIALDRPSSLRQTNAGADFLIIARREWMDALAPLKTLREKQGLATMLLDVEDIFDEFSFGQKTPYALRDFLSYASLNWKRNPRWVLLAGDASFDPRNYAGLPDTDFVPTKLTDTAFMETASDDWLADFNADGLPELAIGRLPIRSPQDAITIVRKLISYELAPPLEEIVLFADLNDGFDFESASSRLRGLLPSTLRVQEIFRSRNNDATTKANLLEALNRGMKLVNSVGHGSVSNWRGNILSTDDAHALSNSNRLPLFVMMNCLNGYFQDPLNESLAEALMRKEHGGAIAVWASSGMTFPSEQAMINQQLYRTLFENTNLTLGEHTRFAKVATSDADVRRSWILFGDPTLRLK